MLEFQEIPIAILPYYIMFNIIVKTNCSTIFSKKFELQKNISQVNHQPAENLFLKRLR